MARKKPIPRKHRTSTSRGNLNRARQYNRDADNVKDVSISLMDLDSAIMYYFTEVIKPTVIEDGETIKVPVMYSSPERWFAVQKLGFMRDKKRQLILPAIAFRRTGMSKDETIPLDTMDPEEPKLHWQFERKYTDANRYDNFSVQQGIIPQREFYNVAVPDFMVLTYDFMIWTHYIEQMNKLVERINWSEGAYWGEPGKMKFRTSIDSYTDSTEVSERERIVRTEFSVTLKGYLIPEAFNELAGPHTMQKHLTPKTLTIGAETDVGISSIVKQEEGVQQVTISGGQSAGLRKTTTDFGLNLVAGEGVIITNDMGAGQTEWYGQEAATFTIASSGGAGTFTNISASNSVYVGDSTSSLDITNTGVTGDWAVDGALSTTGNLIVTGNAVIQGDLTAQSFNAELVSSSIIYQSGSTKFGDGISDTHSMSGSLLISGSLNVNSYNVNEISNDTSLTDSSTTTLVTENAIKSYVDAQITGGASSADTYLRKQFVKKNTTLIGTSTASFSAVTASAPAGISATTENDFMFFLNGQYMEHDALTIQQANGAFYLKVDTDSIGYVLESDDEIIAWGKFNA
jgi:hypothetical protein